MARARNGRSVAQRPTPRWISPSASITIASRTPAGPCTFLRERVGCDRIMLSSDYPSETRDREPLSGVNALVGPTQEDIDGMLGGIASDPLNS
jgi:hypothetical protein